VDSQGQTQTKTINYLITPGVVSQAQKHFDCSSMDAVPLEEFGGSGTAGSHFERRLFLNELMVGSVGWENPSETFAVSQFTLALLEDSGWYKANWTNGVQLLWGKKTGCSMFTSRCEDWNFQNLDGYFCKVANEPTCTYNYRGKGYCAISTYNARLQYYEHLSDPTQGGTDNQMDYCPFAYRYSNGQCTNANQPASDRYPFEYWGGNSGCFDSNVVTPSYTAKAKDTRCLQYTCDTTNKVLKVLFQGTSFTCPTDESYQKFTNMPSGYSGYVACPKLGYTMLCGGGDVSSTGASGTPSGESPGTPGGSPQGSSTPCNNFFGLFCSSSSLVTWSPYVTVCACIFYALFALLN